MKTLKHLAIAGCLILATITISRAENLVDTSNSLLEPLQNFISRTMEDPSPILNEGKNDFVRVSFTVNKDGSLTVNQTNASNIKLDELVRQRLQSILINDAAQYAGKQYSITLRFTIQS